MEMGYKNKVDSSSGVVFAVPGRGNPHVKVSKDARLFRQRTVADVEVWRVMPDRPSSLTFLSPDARPVVVAGIRPRSEMDTATAEKPKQRIPVLGPTRQQTELYLKKRARRVWRHNVVPMDGPSNELTVGNRRHEVAVFDDKAANDVLVDAETQIKSGYPTIAASTLVNRNSLVDDVDDSHTAIKFFSELVKPVKYRWKFQKEQLKTISPSKQGFHPRSQSPTFQRLMEANEKLHGLMRRKSVVTKLHTDEEDSKSEIFDVCDRPAILRYAKSESLSQRTGDLSGGVETVTPKIHERVVIKTESRTIEPVRVDAVCFDEDEDDDGDEDYKSPVPTPPKTYNNNNNNNTTSKISEFKVDFKKMDSHSELHLFLPQIDDAHSRQATPENKRTRNNIHKVSLPNISNSRDVSEIKPHDDDKVKQRRSQKSEYKKKRKKMARIKSGNEEKEIRDRLNDVPTLISLENEKPDLHPSSMCGFDNCNQHSTFKKTLKIRQA